MNTPYRAPLKPIVADQSAGMSMRPVGESYRALCQTAVLSAVFGGFSFTAFVAWFLGVVPLLGILTGFAALRKIRRNRAELTGRGFAVLGITLSIVFWSAAGAWAFYDRYYSVPAGYQRIVFADLDPEADRPDARTSERAIFLDGQKVFLRGYMYPGKQKTGMREFLLMDDAGACTFCNHEPPTSRMIRVKLPDGARADFTSRAIGVGGKFSVHTNPADQEMGGLVYRIDAEIIR